MSNRTLVTGGAGFIGSHLVDQLLAQGNHVTVLDDFSIGLLDNLQTAQATGRLRLVVGSIVDIKAVADAVDCCDDVYHLAVQCVRRSLGRPIESHDVNATGTINVLEAARRAKVKRVVYCSSSEVYGNSSTELLNEDSTICKPVTIYGAAKLSGELYTDAYWRTYGLPGVIVRPFNAFGPRAYQTGTRAEVLPRFVNRILNGEPPVIFGDPSNGRDFTFVTEVATGILKAGASDKLVGERVNIAYGKMISVEDVARIAIDALGRNDLTIELAEPRPGDVHKLHADTTKARAILGFIAKIEFADGVRRYIDWVRATYPDPSERAEGQMVNWTMPPSEQVS